MTVRGRTEWQKMVDDKLKDHEKRLTDQETASAVYKALQAEQRKHLDERFNRVQDNVNQMKVDLTKDISLSMKETTSIKSSINRVLLAIAVAVALSFTQFVIGGGLSLSP